MRRREFLRTLAGSCAATLSGATFPIEARGAVVEDQKKEVESSGGEGAFEWLKMGEVRPRGWILEQMRRDLRRGFAGCLDKLCQEAGSDIFVTNRNSKASRDTWNRAGSYWWNGETEGNWRAGYIMLSYLTEDRAAMRKTDHYLRHILSSQDSDGYLGIFAPGLRYQFPGELWTQACLLRGLLAYSELADSKETFDAVRRSADLTVKVYTSGQKSLPGVQGHDLMIIDVFEWLFDRTGNPKYRDFSLRFYDDWSKRESKFDATLPSLLALNKPFLGHGVHTYENIRVPLWLATAVGRRDLIEARDNAFIKIGRYTEVSGAAVSEEWIKGLPPDPSLTEYEYCSTKELQLTFESALQKTGRARYGDRVERIWFNAAQGARMPDGSAISYLTLDNRLRCDETGIGGRGVNKRNKFSPTFADVAVCCVPNATQVASLFTRGMWMRHRDGGLVATLYGPCEVSTRVDGAAVRIEEQTSYPFHDTIDFLVHLQGEKIMSIYLRNPEWSHSPKITCLGAKIERVGDYWRLRKPWKEGDQIRMELRPEVRMDRAVNGEVAVSYGPLVFAQPLASRRKVIKRYPVAGFEDSAYRLATDRPSAAAFPVTPEAKGFTVNLKQSAANTDTHFPFDKPVLEIEVSRNSGSAEKDHNVVLAPLGNTPVLRRVTFPIAD